MASAKPVIDHEHIRRWVEERQGSPAAMRSTSRGEEPGILRIDFPGGVGEEELEPISWDEGFAKFEQNRLAALLQETNTKGKTSRFIKLVSREE